MSRKLIATTTVVATVFVSLVMATSIVHEQLRVSQEGDAVKVVRGETPFQYLAKLNRSVSVGDIPTMSVDLTEVEADRDFIVDYVEGLYMRISFDGVDVAISFEDSKVSVMTVSGDLDGFRVDPKSAGSLEIIKTFATCSLNDLQCIGEAVVEALPGATAEDAAALGHILESDLAGMTHGPQIHKTIMMLSRDLKPHSIVEER